MFLKGKTHHKHWVIVVHESGKAVPNSCLGLLYLYGGKVLFWQLSGPAHMA